MKFIIFLVLLFPLESFSQEPQLIPQDYYPLSIGDYHEYSIFYQNAGIPVPTFHLYRTVVGDTLLYNSNSDSSLNEFKIVEFKKDDSNEKDYQFERYDSIEGKIIIVNPTLAEILQVGLSPDIISSEWGRYDRVSNLDNKPFIEYVNWEEGLLAYSFRKGVGSLGYLYDANQLFCTQELVFAKVNDEIVYGSKNTSLDNEMDSKFSVEIFPNPVTSSFNLKYTIKTTSSVSISILDINGKLKAQLPIGHKSIGEYTISVDDLKLTSGLYLLKVESDEESEIIKFIVL